MTLRDGWRSRLRKLSPPHAADTLVLALRDETVVVDWVNRGPVRDNWGDAIAPSIVHSLSGRRVVNRRDVFNFRGRRVFTTIGSMLGTVDTPGFEVWGSGFVDSGAQLRATPGRIHAVRGPLSRQKLVEAGVPCPETFGDPAILFPRFYYPTVVQDRDLGIIPHFNERDLPAVRTLQEAGAHIIDIKAGERTVVEEILRCRRVVSSSLHGLVAADAYGIPAVWVRFSDRPYGDGFKFRDYLASTESRSQEASYVSPSDSLSRVEEALSVDGPTRTQMQALESSLLGSCPFLDRDHIDVSGPMPGGPVRG